MSYRTADNGDIT